MKSLLFTASIISVSSLAQAQITIQTNRTALQLAQSITGNGVTVTNATLNCANTGNGIFVSPNSIVGLDGGIVLSTGNANEIVMAEPGVKSSNMNRSGDADLTAISGSSRTQDACVLEFDVVPVGDELQFDYVFASEEYVNAVCGTYNDAFAFFISGPGIVGTKNIALVPNTQIPVAVNSVNNGIVGTHAGSTWSNCTRMGAGSPFTQYYVDNTGNSFFAYKGYTTVFAAKQSVTPCQTYRLKLAIADAGNALYDSGVLIKKGSLSSTSVHGSVTTSMELDNIPTAIKGCARAQINVHRSQASATAQTVQLRYGGSAISGIDYSALPTSVTIPANASLTNFSVQGLATTGRDNKVLEVYIIDPYNCNRVDQYVDTVYLQLLEMPTTVLLNDDDTICAGITITADIQSSRNLFAYNWSPNYNISGINTARPQFTPDVTTTYIVNATIPGSGCPAVVDSVTLTVIEGPKDIKFSLEDVAVCIGARVTVEAQVSPKIDGMRYNWSGPQGFTSQNAIININNIQNNEQGWYRLSVTAEGCNTITDSVYVNVLGKSQLPALGNLEVCQFDQLFLRDADKYNWYTNAFGGQPSAQVPEINTANLGLQTLYISQTDQGCESDRVAVPINVVKCCDKDLFVPNAFSPNNDGLNDVFEIKLDPNSRLQAFYIYNRWGQRVYNTSASEIKWDGMYNAQAVDDGVYYYYLDVQCAGQNSRIERKGELHVIR